MKNIIINNQPILQRIINNINIKKVNSQAYLLSGKSSEYLKKYSILLSKILICPKQYQENCNNCNICIRINNNNYSELKIINPINDIIKKEVIINLRKEFKTNSLEGRNQVYIINEAEKLNSHAANSILKFLEEPDSNTIAIFNSTNIGNVIDTIVSRCQIINIYENFCEGLNYVISTCNFAEENICDVVKFFNYIENDAPYALSNISNLLLEKYNNREMLKKFINVLIFIYSDILNYNYFGKFKYFGRYIELKNHFDKQKIQKIIKKISFLLENIEKLDYNINMLLFIDNLLIGIGEINNG